MRKRVIAGLALLALCLLTAGAALGADVFRFEEKSLRIFEGESALPALERSGAAAEGTPVFSGCHQCCTSPDSN